MVPALQQVQLALWHAPFVYRGLMLLSTLLAFVCHVHLAGFLPRPLLLRAYFAQPAHTLLRARLSVPLALLAPSLLQFLLLRALLVMWGRAVQALCPRAARFALLVPSLLMLALVVALLVVLIPLRWPELQFVRLPILLSLVNQVLLPMELCARLVLQVSIAPLPEPLLVPHVRRVLLRRSPASQLVCSALLANSSLWQGKYNVIVVL